MTEHPTIEDVVTREWWWNNRVAPDSVLATEAATLAMRAVLRELERSKYMSTHYQQMEIVDGVLDRLRAALGEK